MIDPTDKQTVALPLDEQPVKRKRGRPATGKAMTPAEKQKAYRERLKAKGGDRLVKRELDELRERHEFFLDAYTKRINELVAELDEAKAEIERLTATTQE